MKTKLPVKLTTADEAEQFIADLFYNDEFFHLDDDARDIIHIPTGKRLFTDEESDKLNELLGQAFDIWDLWNPPIIETILKQQ